MLFFGLGTGLLIKMIYKDELLTRMKKKREFALIPGTVGCVTGSDGLTWFEI